MLRTSYIEGASNGLEKLGLFGKKKEKGHHQLKSHAAGALAAGAAVPAVGALGRAAVKMDAPIFPGNVDSSKIESHVSNLANQMGVPTLRVKAHDRRLMELVNPAVSAGAYSPSTRTVHIPNNVGEAVALHELGHAASTLRTPGLQGAMLRTAPYSALGSLGAAGYAMGSSDPSYTPAIANLALHAPTLAEEGGASLRAIKHLMQTHGTGQGLWRGRALLPAFGSYALLAGAPLAITAARRAFQDRDR